MLPRANDRPRTAVVLATYNGGTFLSEQLESIRFERGGPIDLFISDDGSRDRTQELLSETAGRWPHGQVQLFSGPKRGFAENFRSLMVNAPIDADMVAFCDQDDIWHEDKLDIAWAALSREDGPAMFCSRTRSIDAEGKPSGLSPLFTREPAFRNALVENIAGGNTMVFNRAAWALLRESAARASFVYHDWWAYIVVTGAGGRVFYSAEPLVDYRQHDANAIGLGNSALSRLGRVGALLTGSVRRNNEAHIAALKASCTLLTPEARKVLAEFESAHLASFPVSLRHLRRSGVFRQTLYGQAGLWVAGVLGRL